MTKAKKRTRANPDIDKIDRKAPGILYSELPDSIAAQLGHVVVRFSHLERQMASVFRIILGVESNEAAILAFSALRGPDSRLAIMRNALKRDHGHIDTAHAYDDILDEFEAISSFRNQCAHGAWWGDGRGGIWRSATDKSAVDYLCPDSIEPSTFEEWTARMKALSDLIIDTTCDAKQALDRAWMGAVASARMLREAAESSRMETKICPECGHTFKGNGWDGIDAHWKSKHENVMPYREAWPLLRDGAYPGGQVEKPE